MDSKITLAFDQKIIERAKKYAGEHDISLSRLIEILLDKLTAGGYKSIEDFPVSDWVNLLADGKTEYIGKARSSKSLKDEFYRRKRK
jgi:hypothetical protein